MSVDEVIEGMGTCNVFTTVFTRGVHCVMSEEFGDVEVGYQVEGTWKMSVCCWNNCKTLHDLTDVTVWV